MVLYAFHCTLVVVCHLEFYFFIYVLINLLVFFLMTMKDIANTAHTSVNLMLGLYAWLAGIIALVIVELEVTILPIFI